MAFGRWTASLPLVLLAASACSSNPTTDASAPATATPAAEAPAAETPAAAENPPAEKPANGEEAKPAAGTNDQWEGEAAAVGAGKSAGPAKEETRTTEVIQQTILANRQAIRDCYDRGRRELPDLKGSMTINLIIDPSGKVKTAELNVERSEIKAPSVVNCAVDQIKKIKFPPSSRGRDSIVNYPFDFKPDGGGSKKKP
jgi:hypothetical protein